MTAEIPESIQTVLTRTIQAYLKDEESFELDLSSLHLRVYIKGPAWAGIVDRPLAKFLVDLDKTVTDELKKHGIELPASSHGLIALKVEEGSLDAVVQYAKGILQEVRKMRVRDQIFIAVVVLGSIGAWNASDIIEQLKKAEVDQVAADENVRLVEATNKGNAAMLEVMTKVMDSTRELQQPLRTLVNNLKPEDTIKLPGHEHPMTKGEAKDVLAKGTRSKVETFKIDRRYIVEGLTTKNPGEWEITLVYGEETFRAKLLITEDEVTELMDSFQLAHASGSNIAPDLQVTAQINAKGVQSATVIGLGEPRDGSLSLGDVMTKLKQPVEVQKTAQSTHGEQELEEEQVIEQTIERTDY